MKNTVILLLLFVLNLINHPGSAQIYPYSHYSSKQGLVNSSVYSIMQDHKGFMWFGTENGLSKFDGINFTNYSQEELGISTIITSLTERDSAHMYIGTRSEGIFLFNYESGSTSKINKTPMRMCSELQLHGNKIHSIHPFNLLETLNLKDSTSNIIPVPENNAPVDIIKTQNGEFIIGTSKGLYRLENNKLHKIAIEGFRDISAFSLFEEQDGSILIAGENAIYSLRNNKISVVKQLFKNTSSRIFNLLRDKRNNIWFSVWGNNDLFMINGNNVVNVSEKMGLNKGTIATIYSDRAGNIWVSILGKGIFLFANIDMRMYPETPDFQNTSIHAIIQPDEKWMIFGTNDGLVTLDQSLNTSTSVKFFPDYFEFVKDLAVIDSSTLLVATSEQRLNGKLSDELNINGTPFKVHYLVCNTIFTGKQFIYSGGWNNNVQLNDKNTFLPAGELTDIFEAQNAADVRIRDVSIDKNENLWIAGQQGLCIIDREKRKWFPEGEFQNTDIADLNWINDSTAALLSAKGFYLLTMQQTPPYAKVKSFTELKKPSCLLFFNENEYLAGTGTGLLYHINNESIWLKPDDGLLSETINDIYYDQKTNKIWIASSEGFMEMNPDAIRNIANTTIPINDIQIWYGDRQIHAHENMEVPFGGHTLSIKLSAFYFANASRIQYQYQLNDEPWVTLSQGKIEFAAAGYGTYLIKVRAGISNGKWGPEKTISLQIAPPFYRTWWFYLLTFAGFLFIVFFFIKKQISLAEKKQLEKNRIEQKLVELQQKALAGNLNPHFVFNSLNSIQHFINSHQPEEANDYLAKFSRLMRMHLNAADKSFIPVQEEINRLEYYLSLEQMRFGDKLQWKINLDRENGLTEIEIPNMIIQPFVENAIWHGIMPSEKNGQVILNFRKMADGTVVIEIIDNGVGVELPLKEKKNGHQSKGMKLIQERLQLLDPSSNAFFTIENASPGTRIRLQLTPKMYRLASNSSPLPH
ncbi:MAG: histidine kinase [Bacteroidia bacterium]|nr:histidine kinase [Bacteroidia bacterium]